MPELRLGRQGCHLAAAPGHRRAARPGKPEPETQWQLDGVLPASSPMPRFVLESCVLPGVFTPASLSCCFPESLCIGKGGSLSGEGYACSSARGSKPLGCHSRGTVPGSCGLRLLPLLSGHLFCQAW